MKTPIIELRNIYKSFSGNKVLDNIDLKVYGGEILCLVGENGSGKSTIIKIISGVYEADEGKVILNGNLYKRLIPTDSIKEGIQVIYQDFSVFPNLTVAENISLGTQIVEGKKFVSWSRMRMEAEKALKKIGVELDLDEDVGNLSVAEKQIVAISRAILQEAKLIIMDEPTTALTQREIHKLYDIINGLSERGIAVIFVSHKLDEVFQVCQRITVVRNGVKVVDEHVDSFRKDKLIYYMTGQDIAEEPFKYREISEDSILSVSKITAKGAFENISFELKPGEILGITGQLGSGRTELAKALFGIIPIDSGEIKIKNKPIELKNIRDALGNKIAYLPEDRLTEGLFLTRSVSDNINAVIVDKMTGRFGLIDKTKMNKEAKKWISELKVNAPSVDIAASTFSGGNQQRLVLGKWLASQPEILVLNCPTVGVDVKSKSEIHRIVKELATSGLAVIMISDDIGELLSSTNRILVMNNGKMTYQTETQLASKELLSEKITDIIDEAGETEKGDETSAKYS
ncbi:MAG: sugar ABC transporter ATP-binding protein [Tissierellaceae bacterium]|nr:sugar ABC transporter ATP-binding protein [Tissierellaceae bacterium]